MYGPEAPLSDLGGLDPAPAAAGLEYEAGPWRLATCRCGGASDTATPPTLSSVVGVLLALYHRKQTGRGQPVWATLLHATAMWSSGVYETVTGRPTTRVSTSSRPASARCTGSTRPTEVGAARRGHPAHWDALCQELGRSDLAAGASRCPARHATAELEAELVPMFATHSDPVATTARTVGVPCELVVDSLGGESVSSTRRTSRSASSRRPSTVCTGRSARSASS